MTKVRDILGPYRLTRLIRVGSSCQVWEAVQEAENKRFALKVLRPEKRDDKAELGFLKHEYEVGKTLSNPRVIKIHEYRVESDTPFLVLELFSELNLKQALRRGVEGIAWLAPEIVEQAAEGLYYLHSKGWVHCDIKPDNFLVSREGRVKLIDFTITERKRSGIAKMFAKKKKTAQGTLSYMSPEQIRKDPLDERSDLYSFGCVLFELVGGRPPYTGYTPNDLLSKHLTASIPSPVASNENVTQEFAELVKRMMAKNPAHRPASMWEFLKEFRALKMFKSPPRKPDIDVFSEVMTVKNPDQLMRTPDNKPKGK
jgi:eukaryotic-like serine/threonine-protein kinase